MNNLARPEQRSNGILGLPNSAACSAAPGQSPPVPHPTRPGVFGVFVSNEQYLEWGWSIPPQMDRAITRSSKTGNIETLYYNEKEAIIRQSILPMAKGLKEWLALHEFDVTRPRESFKVPGGRAFFYYEDTIEDNDNAL